MNKTADIIEEHQGTTQEVYCDPCAEGTHVRSTTSTPPGRAVAGDLVDEGRWLQDLSAPGAPPWQQRLVEAIGLVADELARGPGPVELIVAPSSWHGWVDYVIVRPLREGHPARLRILSLNNTELAIYSWRTSEADPEPSRRARRRLATPVRLYFNLAEVVESAHPTRLDLVHHVTRHVRRSYEAIERA